MKKNIFIFTLTLLFALVTSVVSAQSRVVKGTIVDKSSSPIVGATVVVKGTQNGTITDLDGKFILKVGSANAVLSCSYIGMKSSDVALGSKSYLKITLEEDTKELDQVVVIGYGAVRKKELTGAVSQVKSDDIANILTSDLGNALQGQVSGVNVTAASGAPGESSTILIRGISSISGSNTPLYVVDGVPQDGDPRISSNEIETIDILKDAASCAIYGTRGAAGVILITTKQGKAGAMKVSVDAAYGVQQLREAIDLMNAQEQTVFDLTVKRNTIGGLDENANLELNNRPQYYGNDTDLRDVIFERMAATQNYNVNLSGGRDGLNYNLAAGYFDQEGILINTGFQRFNSRINLNYKRNKVTLGANLNISVEDQQAGAQYLITHSLKYSPFQEQLLPGNTDPIYSDQGNFTNQLNWVASLMSTKEDWHTIKMGANFNAGYDILPSLNLSSRLSISESAATQEYFKPNQEVYGADGVLLSKPEDSEVQRISASSNSMTWDAKLNYNKKFGDHSLTLLGVVSTEVYDNTGFTASQAGVINNDIENLNSTTINPSVAATGRWNQADNSVSLFGTLARAMYNYKSRYLLSASVRADASSRFSAKNRWGVFPSVSAGWNISEEKFWKNMRKTVNSFKLRYSHGTTGNQNFSAYRYTNYVTYGYDAIFGETGSENMQYGATQDAFANPDIKWETTVQDNIGIDLGLWSNKFMVSAEYYNTRKHDMLFDIPLPSGAGVINGTSLIMNTGNMTNQGYELALTYRNSYKGLWYQINSTFSTNDNVITELPIDDDFVLMNDYGIEGNKVTALAEGYEAGAYFLYKTDGIVNTQKELADYRELQPNAKMGDVIYRDMDGDKQITDKDRRYCGSGLPKYEIGLNTFTSYKGFELSMQWYAALGHEIMNGTKMLTYAHGRNKDLVSQWSENNPTAYIPAYRGTNNEHDNFKGYTDMWLEDGSYLRLKNITLGYSLSKKALKKIRLSKVRFYVSAQNLLTFTKYSGYNPEIGGNVASRGLDRANYPATTTYTGSVNLTF